MDVLSILSSYVDIPESAERFVTIDGGPPIDMPAKTFIYTLRNIFRLPESIDKHGPSYTRMSICELKDDFYLGICVVVSDPTPPRTGERPLPPSMELNIPLFTLGKPISAIPPLETVVQLANLACIVIQAFPLHACREITVAHLLFEDEEMWIRALAHLKSVVKLHVRPGPKLVLGASFALAKTRSSDQPCSPLFPNLETLHLEQVDFSDPDLLASPYRTMPNKPVPVKPSFKLEVTRSYGVAEVFEDIRRDFNGAFTWDGITDVSARSIQRSWRRRPFPTVTPLTLTPVVPVA
jgi:hypothetical protein